METTVSVNVYFSYNPTEFNKLTNGSLFIVVGQGKDEEVKWEEVNFRRILVKKDKRSFFQLDDPGNYSAGMDPKRLVLQAHIANITVKENDE